MGTAVAKRAATAVKHQKSISEMVVQINVAIYRLRQRRKTLQ